MDNKIWFARFEEDEYGKILDMDVTPEAVWQSSLVFIMFVVFVLGFIIGLLFGLGVS